MPDRSTLAAIRLKLAKQFPEALAPIEPLKDIPVAKTGSMLLDAALSVGGLPMGRLIELSGVEQTGKSTIALTAAAYIQKDYGRPCLWVDYEHSFDPDYARQCGLDTSPDMLIVAQPSDFETGMEIIEAVLDSDSVGSIILDSIASMQTRKQLAGDVGDVHMAPMARAMSQEMPRLLPKVQKSRCLVIFINQIREQIGGFNPTNQPRTTTPGGRALRHYASVRIELKAIKSIKGRLLDPATGKQIEGNVAVQIRATIVKSKVGPPFRNGTYYLEGGRGISEARTLLEVGEARGVVKRSGSRITLPFRSASTGEFITLAGNAAALDWLGRNRTAATKLADKILRLVQSSGDLNLLREEHEDSAEGEYTEEEAPEGDETPTSSEDEDEGRNESAESFGPPVTA